MKGMLIRKEEIKQARLENGMIFYVEKSKNSTTKNSSWNY